MKLKIPIFSTTIAVTAGIAALFLYFSPLFFAGIDWRSTLLQWAVSLSAVALVVGLGNLASVHFRKMDDEGGAPVYSGVLLVTMLITFGIVLVLGPSSPGAIFILSYIQVPIEASLFAILAVSLLYASTRLLRRRADVFTLVFVGTALIVLLTTSPLITGLPAVGSGLQSFRLWITNVVANAGARGILLGIALGTITTGLRILMGTDRPYGG